MANPHTVHSQWENQSDLLSLLELIPLTPSGHPFEHLSWGRRLPAPKTSSGPHGMPSLVGHIRRHQRVEKAALPHWKWVSNRFNMASTMNSVLLVPWADVGQFPPMTWRHVQKTEPEVFEGDWRHYCVGLEGPSIFWEGTWIPRECQL